MGDSHADQSRRGGGLQILLDRAATIARMLQHMADAAAAGAKLVVFPEAYIPGYPSWVWRLKPGGDMALAGEIHARLREQSVDIARGDLSPLTEAAAHHGLTMVCGLLTRMNSEFSGTTLFNSVVVIGPDGAILNRHRKLLPTNPERMVSGTRRCTRATRRRNACRSDRMPDLLGKFYAARTLCSVCAESEEILVAPTWDCGEEWIASMRHIAREGGCWVIATGTAIQAGDVPKTFPGREQLFNNEDEWLCDGGALIVRPFRQGRSWAAQSGQVSALL